MTDRKSIMNDSYDALLYTVGAVAISMVTKKILKENLSVPGTTEGILKLGAAIGGGMVLVKTLQEKKFIPDDPFK